MNRYLFRPNTQLFKNNFMKMQLIKRYMSTNYTNNAKNNERTYSDNMETDDNKISNNERNYSDNMETGDNKVCNNERNYSDNVKTDDNKVCNKEENTILPFTANDVDNTIKSTLGRIGTALGMTKNKLKNYKNVLLEKYHEVTKQQENTENKDSTN